MKKIIIVAFSLIVSVSAFAQKQPQADTAKLKTEVLSDQSISNLYHAIEITKKGLPSATDISANEAKDALMVLSILQQQVVLINNERNKSKEQKPAENAKH